MSEHVMAWLQAYHDGELESRRLRKVEAHLAGCATCRAELDELRSLTALLGQSPGASVLTPPARFVAQVGLRLSRHPERPAWQRALETGWRWVPAGLLGTLAVGEAVFIVATLLMAALQLGLGGSALADALPAWGAGSGLFEGLDLAGGASLGNAGGVLWGMLNNGGPLGWAFPLNFVFLVVMGLSYWSWLASWWVYRQRRQV